MIVIDSHCDTPSRILRLGPGVLRDSGHGHVDVPKLKKGGVDASFFALYTPASIEGDAATGYATSMLAATLEAVAGENDLRLARSAADIRKNKAAGLVSVLLGMENGSPIGKSLPLLRFFHRLGVRYMTLTHNGDNEIADAAAGNGRWHGLSPFGREVVREMNRLGMLVDTAHVSDETFYDCLELSSAPIVSTHSCCRALCGHRRNMTDDMIRKMADKGGVIQINFFPCFLSDGFSAFMDRTEAKHPEYAAAEEAFLADPQNRDKRARWEGIMDLFKTFPRPGVSEVADHIDHAVKVGGLDHVGIGTDFDGIGVPPEGLDDISALPRLFDELKRRGYSDDAVDKIAGGNFLRVLEEVERNAKA